MLAGLLVIAGCASASERAAIQLLCVEEARDLGLDPAEHCAED